MAVLKFLLFWAACATAAGAFIVLLPGFGFVIAAVIVGWALMKGDAFLSRHDP